MNHNAADQAGSCGCRNGIDVIEGHACVGQRSLHKWCHQFSMGTGYNFRDDAAKGAMMVLLTGECVGQNCAIGTHNGRRRFIAA